METILTEMELFVSILDLIVSVVSSLSVPVLFVQLSMSVMFAEEVSATPIGPDGLSDQIKQHKGINLQANTDLFFQLFIFSLSGDFSVKLSLQRNFSNNPPHYAVRHV